MRSSLLRPFHVLIVASTAFVCQAEAEPLFALRDDNTLLRFDSRTPGTLDLVAPITGVGAGDTLRALDFRPADGRLYAVGSDAAGSMLRLYRIDQLTSVASALGAPFAVAPASVTLGMDFNPTVDRLRVINSLGANLRIDPDSGAMIDADSGLGGAQQDEPLPAGSTYHDAAYNRSFVGAPASSLFVIDAAADLLLRVGGIDGMPSPNEGDVTTVGPLGFAEAAGVRGLEFVGPTLYLVARQSATANLYTVDPTSGAATLVGALGGNPAIVGLAGPSNTRLLTQTEPGVFQAAGSLVAGQRVTFAFPAANLSRVWALADAGGPGNDSTASRDVSLRMLTADFWTVQEEDRGDTRNTGEDDTREGGSAGILAGSPVLAATGINYLEISEGFLDASSDDAPVSPYKLSAVVTGAGVPEVEFNDSASFANSITGATQVRTGTIGPQDRDVFFFDAIAGDVVLVAFDGHPSRFNSLNHAGMYVQLHSDTLLQAVASNNPPTATNSTAAGFSFHIMRSGRHYVVIGSIDTEGAYAVLVKKTRRVPSIAETTGPNGSPALAQVLEGTTGAVQIVGGALSPGADTGGDADFYSSQASPGSRVWAYVDTGGPLNQSSGLSRDSTLTLSANGGTTIIETDDNDGTGNGGDDGAGLGNGGTETYGGDASVIAGPLLTGGTYQLRVGEAGEDQPIDPYRLFVFVTHGPESGEFEPNNTPAQAMSAGSGSAKVVNAAIGTLGDIDWYAIDAAADDIAFIAADGDIDRDGEGTDLKLRLLAPNGTTSLINGADGVDSSGESAMPGEGFNFRFIEAGRYYLTVQQHTDSETGSYRLMIEGSNLFADGFE